MPKVIVLFHGADLAAARLAQSAAVGAESVRFTEVDIRTIGPTDSSSDRRRQPLSGPEKLVDYDGVVIASAGERQAGDPAVTDLIRLVDDLRATTSRWTNVVFTLIGSAETPLLSRLAQLGGMVLAVQSHVNESDARAAGERNAKVVSWVRHALSHEHHDHSHREPESGHSHESRPTA